MNCPTDDDLAARLESALAGLGPDGTGGVGRGGGLPRAKAASAMRAVADRHGSLLALEARLKAEIDGEESLEPRLAAALESLDACPADVDAGGHRALVAEVEGALDAFERARNASRPR